MTSPRNEPAPSILGQSAPNESTGQVDPHLVAEHIPAKDASDGKTHPTLLHRFRSSRSILTLVISQSGDFVYAGTQAGEIIVYALKTYERIETIQAHCGAVLGLSLIEEAEAEPQKGTAKYYENTNGTRVGSLGEQRVGEQRGKLFSCAGDRLVNVWNIKDFRRLASIYSVYDVGDVFCVTYCASLGTVYLGAQNTSIQWCNINDYHARPTPDPQQHPSRRSDRFFDSSGPGGVPTPRPQSRNLRQPLSVLGGRVIEISSHHIQQFAHFGYVYCMLLARGTSLGTVADEQVLISGGGDGAVKLWRLDEKDEGRIHELARLGDERDEGDSILSIVVEGTFLYAGRVDGEINVWDLETRQLVRILKAHREDVLSMTITDGMLFGAAVDGVVKKFNQRYECMSSWKAHEGRVLASASTISSGRFIYVSGSNDDSVAIWDVSAQVGPVMRYQKTNQEELVETLRQFISYRTVSSDPRYSVDCRRAASYLRAILKKFGATTELFSTDGGYNPVVFGRFRGNAATASSRKKILFYGHYDVVAAENTQSKWLADPFTMQGVDGFLYGRGVTDNKGPIIAAIYAVAELVSQQSLESDIVFLIEGEEECGSRGFEAAVRRHKQFIGPVDWILLANSYWIDDEVPCLTYGLRGVIHTTVEVNSDEPDLHSGVDGSRLLDEPLKDLVMLLACLSGPRGAVHIPGFYDTILPITAAERELYDRIAHTLLARNPSLGTPEELTTSLMERWANASLTIHTFKTSGSENTTIIPHHARANISIRLVPNQHVADVAASLVAFLHERFAQFESKNHLRVTIDHQAEPWLGDPSNQIFRTLEDAVTDVWDKSTISRRRHSSSSTSMAPGNIGVKARRPSSSTTKPLVATSSTLTAPSPAASPTSAAPPLGSLDALVLCPSSSKTKPLYIREGGSIPAVRFLELAFDAPAAHLPCGQASDHAHLENERMRVLNLYNARDIFKRVFLELPRKGHRSS